MGLGYVLDPRAPGVRLGPTACPGPITAQGPPEVRPGVACVWGPPLSWVKGGGLVSAVVGGEYLPTCTLGPRPLRPTSTPGPPAPGGRPGDAWGQRLPRGAPPCAWDQSPGADVPLGPCQGGGLCRMTVGGEILLDRTPGAHRHPGPTVYHGTHVHRGSTATVGPPPPGGRLRYAPRPPLDRPQVHPGDTPPFTPTSAPGRALGLSWDTPLGSSWGCPGGRPGTPLGYAPTVHPHRTP